MHHYQAIFKRDDNSDPLSEVVLHIEDKTDDGEEGVELWAKEWGEINLPGMRLDQFIVIS